MQKSSVERTSKEESTSTVNEVGQANKESSVSEKQSSVIQLQTVCAVYVKHRNFLLQKQLKIATAGCPLRLTVRVRREARGKRQYCLRVFLLDVCRCFVE